TSPPSPERAPPPRPGWRPPPRPWLPATASTAGRGTKRKGARTRSGHEGDARPPRLPARVPRWLRDLHGVAGPTPRARPRGDRPAPIRGSRTRRLRRHGVPTRRRADPFPEHPALVAT